MDIKELFGEGSFEKMIDDALAEAERQFYIARTPAQMLIIILATATLRDAKYRLRSKPGKAKKLRLCRPKGLQVRKANLVGRRGGK
ncbi:MAG TPA: hypothetical protein VM531_11025 [Sphingomicrobium sp.]|jgi:hypothetical protein|nr:hypothetical protein [Sphingomicrobium sp.]